MKRFVEGVDRFLRTSGEGMPFPWRWNGCTNSTDLDVIWGMSAILF